MSLTKKSFLIYITGVSVIGFCVKRKIDNLEDQNKFLKKTIEKIEIENYSSYYKPKEVRENIEEIIRNANNICGNH